MSLPQSEGGCSKRYEYEVVREQLSATGHAGELTIEFWDWRQLVRNLVQNHLGSTQDGVFVPDAVFVPNYVPGFLSIIEIPTIIR